MELVLDDPRLGLPVVSSETSRNTSKDDITLWREELDSYYKRMQDFPDLDPTDIFRELAAYTARASELRGYCVRIGSRGATTFRTQEIDYFLSEADRQFRDWSRVITVRGQEITMAGGF